ncbi:MAG: glutamate 5-kinase [Lachnospiraceae bacterium]|nr:glutamate 5-kinase [Lachnospiraceae bacterium]
MDLYNRFGKVKRIVVKVGTSTITYENGLLNLRHIEKLAKVLSDLKNKGMEVVLVTSGAIGTGAVSLGFKDRPKIMREKQATAAVGQAMLIQIYHKFFIEYNQKIAQVLLTKEDIKENERRENAINTFNTLFEFGVIPIVNANDTVSTNELDFSDNDRLSAHVSEIIGADLLVILTDIDALYDGNPKTNPNAKRISQVTEITDEILNMAGDKGSTFSIGGMSAKLYAAKICEEGNVDMAVANGDKPEVIYDILEGKDVGTYFLLKK